MTVVRAAGGIPVRTTSGGTEVLVVHRPHYDDWTFPKGKCEPGESDEACALREVAEETGLEVRITGPLDSIRYTFVQSGRRIHKTVHYFMMEPVGGDLARHDHEFDEVRWIDFDEAPAVLTFETERALVAQAADLLTDDPAERAS